MNKRFFYGLSRFILIFLAVLSLASCATLYFEGNAGSLPPVLSQEEITRPYTSLGRIQIVVEQYVMPISDLQSWGHHVLREEAARMGADAVMLPEISSRPAPHLVIPAQEYRATGVAIRFK